MPEDEGMGQAPQSFGEGGLGSDPIGVVGEDDRVQAATGIRSVPSTLPVAITMPVTSTNRAKVSTPNSASNEMPGARVLTSARIFPMAARNASHIVYAGRLRVR